MIELPLSRGMVALIDDCDAHLAAFKWYALVNRQTVYAVRNEWIRGGAGRRRRIHLHRAVMGFPVAYEVDHINGNGLDNRRSNLRLATSSQNHWNRRVDRGTRSGFKGVTWHKRDGKWQAAIRVDQRSRHLGLFVNPEDAARAYDAAALEAWGEFARLNFPEAA